MIKAIAIDDELPALQIIENFCKRSGMIELQKTFSKPNEALKHLRKFPTDLLFLDINMPAMSGIELYKSVEQNTMVIFTTAYSEFAVEGFNLNAVDYLLKPYTYERFLQAVTKAKELSGAPVNAEKNLEQFLFVRADYSLVKIAVKDITLVEGLDDYLKIHLGTGKNIVTRMTMKGILEKLPASDFIRVHRSFIIPIHKVETVRKKIIYVSGKEIPIGSSYEEEFFSIFKP
ncbi:MAG: LytR/AlgR family response regulator transcription factor [Bacteroidia bacterium]